MSVVPVAAYPAVDALPAESAGNGIGFPFAEEGHVKRLILINGE